MRARYQIVFTVAVLAALGLLARSMFSPGLFGEKYEGRTLHDWAFLQGVPDPREKARVHAAVAAMCTNRFPELVAALDHDPYDYAGRQASRFKWMPYKLFAWLRDGPLADRAEPRAVTAEVALRALGEDAAPAIPYIEALAGNSNHTVAQRAFYVLPNAGTNGVAHLLAAAQNEAHPRQREAILTCVLWTRMTSTNATPAMVEAMLHCTQSHDPVVVRWAAVSVGNMRLQPTNSIPALIRVMSNAEPGARVGAIWGVEQFGENAREAMPDLRRLMHDPSPDVQKAALAALVAIGRAQMKAGTANGDAAR